MEINDIKSIMIDMQIADNEINELLSISKIKDIKENEYFISEGHIPKKFAIVLKGLFRYFYINDKGDEFTKGLIPSKNILVSYTSMSNQIPSLYTIEALEDSIILEINYKNWIELQKRNSNWDKFLIKTLEKGYFSKEKRERDLLLLDAETRYRNFTNEFPNLCKKVKLQIIASYIGVKPESLSRIRKKMNS